MKKSRYSTEQSSQLRHRIAVEAARLIARKKVRNFHTARMRAMRWLSQTRLSSAEVPTQEEVMKELDAISLSADWNTPSQELMQPSIESQNSSLEINPDKTASDQDHKQDTTQDTEQWGIIFRPLLESLANFQWDYESHPEGDALYHSLQVYQLGRDLHPYDEEFQWACLLHDVGFVVDPRLPREAAGRILEGRISERIEFLICELDYAHAYLKGTQLPKWLRRHESIDELIDLARCDRQGRSQGVAVPTLEQALKQLSQLSKAFD